MVLFAFIIMLLNVKLETSPFRRPVSVAVGVIIAGLFLGQLIGIIYSLPGAKDCGRCPMASAEQAWNDLKIGQNEANEATECNAGVACGLRASTSAFTNAEIDRLINNGQQQGNVESAQAPGAAASGKHGVNGLPLDKIAICGQKQRNYAFSGNSIDCLLLSSSIQAPRITLPPLSPKCSAHLYPEGTTIRAEINNGEFPDTALLGRTPSAVGYQPNLAEEMADLQERITSTRNGSITSMQAVYVPADDLTDPAPATTFAHLDSTVVLERALAAQGLFPAVDPLSSTSKALAPETVGEEHYQVARGVQMVLQRYKDLQDMIAILGMDELGEEDKLTVTRARKLQKFLSQPFSVAENFTGLPGKYVPLAETVKGFAAIVDGKCDDLPEWAFFNVGTLDDARKKAADKLAEEKGGEA